MSSETENLKNSAELQEDSVKRRRKRIKLPEDLSQVERFAASETQGLSAEQVESRIETGFVNVDGTRRGKSIAGIIFSNLFTFFNIIYIIIAVVLCLYGLASQCTFLPVVIANTAIAIVQEIKSKLTLDKLNLLNEPKIEVVRDGEKKEIPVTELVLDDVVHLYGGAQISADCKVLSGFVEVNESILTGESEAVTMNVLSTSCT